MSTTTTNPTNQSDRLARIAKELVDVANVEVESMAQMQLSADLQALKTSFEKGLNTLSDTNRKSLDKLENLQAELKNLKVAQDKTNALLEAQAKRQKLEFAVAECSGYRTFWYISSQYGFGSSESSDTLVRKILKDFLLGFGSYLPLNVCTGGPCTETSQKEFRDLIVSIITDLTGTEPRVVKSDNGQYVIYQS